MNPRLALVTSVPSPHQIPLGKAMFALSGESFRMVFTTPMDDERKSLGWQEPESDSPYVLCTWQSADAQQRLREILQTYDAVVYGSVPMDLVRERIRAGKLTFCYMERPFKRGVFLGVPWWFNRLRRNFWPLDLPNHHLLAAGAYCSRDLSQVRMFFRRQWKWGYFTPVNSNPPLERSDHTIKLLWAGRMLKWKQVNLLLQAIRIIHQSRNKVSLNIIGDGSERERLMGFVVKNNMQDYVTFHPPVPVDRVREFMSSSHIYVMPSNYHEGWGAVINEAMAEGCCVVSSTGPGAAPWLIDHGQTGYLFPSGNLKALCSVLSPLIDNANRCQEIGRNAWEKMRTLWSPEVAAERLVSLTAGLLGFEPLPDYSAGPCSRA